MALVHYSDSDSEHSSEVESSSRVKRRKIEPKQSQASTLPPLPPGFRDLYSSTVRTSTQDDPSLHGGRQRVTPHTVGKWPTHVYLEWLPKQEETQVLKELIQAANEKIAHTDNARLAIHSLLESDLGVDLPLHISLSRPMALKTDEKQGFLICSDVVLSSENISSFDVRPTDLIWHPNEDLTRWFLVLRLSKPENDQLSKLLENFNTLALQFDQPLLYQARSDLSSGVSRNSDSFHISIAWSLSGSSHNEEDSGGRTQYGRGSPLDISKHLRTRMESLQMHFDEVKIRIGQDVTMKPLQRQRGS